MKNRLNNLQNLTLHFLPIQYITPQEKLQTVFTDFSIFFPKMSGRIIGFCTIK